MPGKGETTVGYFDTNKAGAAGEGMVLRTTGWEVMLRLTQIVLVPLMGFLAYQVWLNTKSLAEIGGNRFTSAHGLEVWREISSIREDIAGMPTEIPPAWFLEEVRGLEMQMRNMQGEITTMRITVEANHR